MDSCSTCPLYGRPKVLGYGDRAAGRGIIGGAPVVSGTNPHPFRGREGKLLEALAQQMGAPLDTWWSTNLVACCLPGRGTLSAQEISACRARLEQEVQGLSTLLLLGEQVAKAFFPTAKTLGSIQGRWAFHAPTQTWCLPTVHPGAVFQNPDTIRDLIEDMKLFLRGVPQTLLHPPEVEYTLCSTVGDLVRLRDSLEVLSPEFLALDIETTSLNPREGEILCIGLSAGEKNNWVILPAALKDPSAVRLFDQILKRHPIVTHNGYQFDWAWIRHHYGLDQWRITFDTLLAHYALDERQHGHGLKRLASRYLGAPDYALDTRDLTQYTPSAVYSYLVLDCYYTWSLAPLLKRELQEVEGLTRLHDQYLLAGARTLALIEATGVLVDQDYLATLQEKLDEEYQKLYLQIQAIAQSCGMEEVNPNSSKQVASLLYDYLKVEDLSTKGIAIVGRGRKGWEVKPRSTEKEVLEKISHPVAKLILDARQVARFRSTYVQGLTQCIEADGRVRSDYLLFGTVTGRISSRNPNLQNIPILAGTFIRDAYIASPGYTFIEADYSQLELRVAAHYSQDKTLIAAFQSGEDIHRVVASQIYHVPPEEVQFEQRYKAKWVSFGLLYGRGARSLAAQLQVSEAEAQEYIDKFFAQFPGFTRWVQGQHRKAVEEGEVVTWFGNRRRFPFVTRETLGEVQRRAVNSPIQGTASHICLYGMGKVLDAWDPELVRGVLTVHDQILLECRDDLVTEVVPRVKELMQKVPFPTDVPFPVDIKIGKRWGSLKDLEVK